MTLRHQQSTKDVKFACQERSGLLDSIYSALYKSDPTRFFTHFVNVPNGGVFPAYQFLPSEHGYAGGWKYFYVQAQPASKSYHMVGKRQ